MSSSRSEASILTRRKQSSKQIMKTETTTNINIFKEVKILSPF